MRGDVARRYNAGEDGCLRGRDPWDPLRTTQVRTRTGMDACIQGRPDPLPARQPYNHPEDSREGWVGTRGG